MRYTKTSRRKLKAHDLGRDRHNKVLAHIHKENRLDREHTQAQNQPGLTRIEAGRARRDEKAKKKLITWMMKEFG